MIEGFRRALARFSRYRLVRRNTRFADKVIRKMTKDDARQYGITGHRSALTFSEALDLVKLGGLVSRRGWSPHDQYIYLVDGSEFKVNRPPLLGIYPPGTEIVYQSHIDMKTADGSCVPWLASQTDLLAEDWYTVSR